MTQDVVCLDFADGSGSCVPEAQLSLINSDKAYYHYTLSQSDNPIEVYFFYAGVFRLKFRCHFATSNGKGKEGEASLEIDKVIYLQGGHQYLAMPVLPFPIGDSRCKVKIQELHDF